MAERPAAGEGEYLLLEMARTTSSARKRREGPRKVAAGKLAVRGASRILFATADAVPSLSSAAELARTYVRRYARLDPGNVAAIRALEAVFARVCVKWEALYRADAYAACTPALASLQPAEHAITRAKIGGGAMPDRSAAAAASAPPPKRKSRR